MPPWSTEPPQLGPCLYRPAMLLDVTRSDDTGGKFSTPYEHMFRPDELNRDPRNEPLSIEAFGIRYARASCARSRLGGFINLQLLLCWSGPLHATWLKGEALTRCSDANRGARV
ncbi:uncharacterized protein Triagg1_9850 [Trichoderma aggressivum f. europaeum]|uniref:Uncharacterized protein n=1 Tax=Trichoderma aggressivum f. europaeum TaxID=173218 RepID=A0AAE1M0C3_9HYPO|nr:hypothetical protein Triagg1_9850 [Trichoderma aggressivum f. europaeum]